MVLVLPGLFHLMQIHFRQLFGKIINCAASSLDQSASSSLAIAHNKYGLIIVD